MSFVLDGILCGPPAGNPGTYTAALSKHLSPAYSVPWWHLQKRTYENGNAFNRVAFAVTDSIGNYVLTNVVKSVTLEGPGGAIALSALDFMTYQTLYGSLNHDPWQWYYDSDFQFENYYSVNFGGTLQPGNYTLTVVDLNDGTIFYETKYFNGVVELPQFSSDSFHGYEDDAGNLLWQWELPMDTNFWAFSNADISIRCWVSIFNGNNYVGDVSIRVPVTVGGMFVPSRVMDLARQKGDNFKVGLHVRTNANQNRYYTNSIPLRSLKKTLKRVVVVPLN
jgi:hypothetical protein